jgi:uncharacterized protein YjbJ (UPF0337 family)
MNRDQWQGIWKQFSGVVKQAWGTLCGEPHAVAAGTRDRVAGRILIQRGVSKRDGERQLADFMRRNRDWSDLSNDQGLEIAVVPEIAASRLHLVR